jgi:hypothetical protein
MGTRIASHRAVTVALVSAATLMIGFVLYWFSPQSALVDRRVEEAIPTDVSTGDAQAGTDEAVNPAAVEAKGEFRSLEHDTTGTATLLRLDDGSLVLRFEDLSTLNGPDLRVYVSSAPADADPSTFGTGSIDLGSLKANEGDQNYEVPDDVSANELASAVIWCRRFSVGFGVAPLAPAVNA